MPTSDRRTRRLARATKRGIDVVGAAVGLAACSPIIVVLCVLVRIRLGAPVFFRQVRIGRDGREFRIVKLRTMKDAHDADGLPLPDDARLTPFGRRLRALSLDELPELWNVLCGDMSLVGPRPLLPEYLPLYSPRQARRHEVRPGLTGLAQVSGRNALSWADRLELDVHYVETWGLKTDLAVLARTIAVVVNRTGISADDHASMPRFEGFSGVASSQQWDAGQEQQRQ